MQIQVGPSEPNAQHHSPIPTLNYDSYESAPAIFRLASMQFALKY